MYKVIVDAIAEAGGKPVQPPSGSGLCIRSPLLAKPGGVVQNVAGDHPRRAKC